MQRQINDKIIIEIIRKKSRYFAVEIKPLLIHYFQSSVCEHSKSVAAINQIGVWHPRWVPEVPKCPNQEKGNFSFKFYYFKKGGTRLETPVRGVFDQTLVKQLQ